MEIFAKNRKFSQKTYFSKFGGKKNRNVSKILTKIEIFRKYDENRSFLEIFDIIEIFRKF